MLNKTINIINKQSNDILKHTLWSFILKGIGILITFIIIPLNIKYLDSNKYGLWLTLSSILSWFSLFDIGIGHGLRNKYAIAIINKDITKAKYLVSTAYFSLSIIVIILILIFVINLLFFDLNSFFGLRGDNNLFFVFIFSSFLIEMVLKLVISLYLADQKHSIGNEIFFLNNLMILIFFYGLTKFGPQNSLLHFSLIYLGLPILILFTINLFSFKRKFLNVKPEFIYFSRSYLKDIFAIGTKFFIIQIAGVILFTTDNLIISKTLGNAEVVPYNMTFKYYGIISIALSIILSPYWSKTTLEFEKQNFTWIKKTTKKLNIILIVSIFILIILYWLSPYLFNIWLGEKVKISTALNIGMAINILIYILYAPSTILLNGMGKLKIQLISLSACALINIPLSLFLVKNTNLGSVAVIIATIICLIPHTILSQIQLYKIINFKAKGIWNE